jgi:hypothetical protein
MSPDDAKAMLDAYRAEVLAEAADVAREETHRLEAGNQDARAARGARSVAYLLRRLAEAGKDTGGAPAGESTQPLDAPALLALATVLEVPRRDTAIPLQLRRSHGHADRWAICDRTGRRWYRDLGWMYEPADDRLCDEGRFTLAEAVPLAQELAASACGVNDQDGAS